MIEQRRPQPGIMAVLDDVSAQLHGVKEGADQNLKGKLSMALGQNEYFDDSGVGCVVSSSLFSSSSIFSSSYGYPTW